MPGSGHSGEEGGYDKLVGYEQLDAFKRRAQEAAKGTAQNLANCGYREIGRSRGESVYLYENAQHILAHVDEGLGNKNRILEDVLWESECAPKYVARIKDIAQDTLASALNDLATSGAKPLSVSCHLSLASSTWLTGKVDAFIEGWVNTCNAAGVAWGPGETASLESIIHRGTAALGCSVVGQIRPKSRYIRGTVKAGDAIVVIASSGLHANGFRKVQEIVRNVPQRYLTPIQGGRTFGEALLDPAPLYGPLVSKLLDKKVPLHYAVNVTGHGWRKFMRLREPFEYFFFALPAVHPVFNFLQTQGDIGRKEMYGTYNMGAGFAFFVPQKHAPMVCGIAREMNYQAHLAGTVKKSPVRRVVIHPPSWQDPIVFEEDELDIR